jgi:hypothetical protein
VCYKKDNRKRVVRRENQCSAVRKNPLNFLQKERAAFEPVA